MDGGFYLAKRKAEVVEEPDEEENWDGDTDHPKKRSAKIITSRIIILSLIVFIAILTIIAISIIISLQKEDEPSERDVMPPVLTVISPDPTSIYAPGENFTIEIDTGESLEDVPSVTGILSDEEYENDVLDFDLEHSSDSTWTVNISIPEDMKEGDWFIFIQAWDKMGNEGSVEIQIIVEK